MSEEDVHNDELSLEQIEDVYWGDPPEDATRLMATIHGLRHKPIGQLEIEDLRILVSQGEGFDVLLPRVLALLEQDPLIEGDFFPGDVLIAVLRVPVSYWVANPLQRGRIELILATIEPPDKFVADSIEKFQRKFDS